MFDRWNRSRFFQASTPPAPTAMITEAEAFRNTERWDVLAHV
jgi:hypothetical protein